MNIPVFPAEHLERLVATLADLVLVLDDAGVIQDVQVHGKELQRLGLNAWQGVPLLSLANVDSQEKVKALLDAVQQPAPSDKPIWRHINLSTDGQTGNVPLQVATVYIANTRQTWLFGRDLSGVSQMQQRLVEAHQGMERDLSLIHI